jgi:hypothetical protein
MNDGLGLNGKLTASDLTRPMRTPAQILNSVAPYAGPETKGYLEKRDWVFNRISNIATIRSDTFSVYGTVQLVISGTTATVARTRRFWALLDRSVALAYAPGNPNFMHPRLMNFQWLD